jgi:hypothetical protein
MYQSMKILKRFGIEPGRPFRVDNINIVRRLLLEKAVSIARRRLQETAERDRGRNSENNWSVIRSGIGVYKTDYEIRAFVAMIGLGALPAEEVAYANARKDRKGNPWTAVTAIASILTSARPRRQMPSGRLPSMIKRAFWSAIPFAATQSATAIRCPVTVMAPSTSSSGWISR